MYFFFSLWKFQLSKYILINIYREVGDILYMCVCVWVYFEMKNIALFIDYGSIEGDRVDAILRI